MALITHQTQGSCSNFSLRPKVRTKGVKLRYSATFPFFGKGDEFISLKHRFHMRSQLIILPKRKAFKISSFKRNGQYDESEDGDSGTKSSKSAVQISSTQQEREEVISEYPEVTKHPPSLALKDREGTSSGAIERLFRKWLIIMRTQTSNQTVDEEFREKTAQPATTESQPVAMRMKVGAMMKAALEYFVGLDAAVSVPLLIFIPWYLTVKVLHGAEVTKELTPLWVLGPLIVALYIKIIQGLCSLYLFIFTQAIKLVKNLPTYCMLAYTYIAEGKLKAYLWARFWKPIMDIKNLDYGALLGQKLKQLKEWAVEKYLDYVESIWPYYCRTIRFLKKAHLI